MMLLASVQLFLFFKCGATWWLFHRPENHNIMLLAAANNIDAVRPIFDSDVNWSGNSTTLFESIGLTGPQRHFCLSTVDQVSISYT